MNIRITVLLALYLLLGMTGCSEQKDFPYFVTGYGAV